MLKEGGPHHSMRFTSAIANGQDLYAFRYAVNDAANTLYYRTSGYGVVVVSEPLDEDHGSWKAVPENSVLVAEAGKKVEIISLDEVQLQAAE
jgi:glutamine amidotransferase